MRYKHPVKQILISTRSSWDRPATRPAVRHNFDKVTKCGTPALGAEVFASETEEKLVPHTCKVRPCPSCGHRATIQWQREQWCALPDVPYAGIVLTTPDVLWPIFQQNRHLLHDLPTLGALAKLSGKANRLTDGWALSGITRFATGLPVTFASFGDNALVYVQNNGVNSV
jgi:Transposase zinc-binding domain